MGEAGHSNRVNGYDSTDLYGTDSARALDPSRSYGNARASGYPDGAYRACRAYAINEYLG